MVRRKFNTEEERQFAKKERQKKYEEARKGGQRLPTSRLNQEEEKNLTLIYSLAPENTGKCKVVMKCIEFCLNHSESFQKHLNEK